MASSGAVYRYGASYSPLVYPADEWDSDLRQMQAAGMNLIRMGDVHGSWDRIEPQEGQVRLDVLEAFYRSAARFGQDILLSTGASCPPLWLALKYPDSLILSNRGERYPLAASYHWACIHHPDFLAASDRYLETLTRFAVTQPNHFGWQISNEIGFPFNPTREPGRVDLYCYCDHSKGAFREWVRAKYGTLEALNAAWMWSTTAFWYNDWSEIDPPEATPETWSGVTRWLDWRLFWQDSFTRFARHQHELIHQHDAEHPTSINTFAFKSYDRFGTYTGLDQWQLSGVTDHIGYDLYPGSGAKLLTRPEHNSIFLDHGRSVSRFAGRDFWLHEIESGPIGGWVLGPDYNTGPADIWRNGLEALGHDVKLILYMPWREWDYQPLHWGALVDLDGEPTPRLEAAAELGAYIQQNSEFLRVASTPPAEFALLESKPNAIFLRGIDQEELLFAAQRGAYRTAWELGYSIDFATPAQLRGGQPLPWRAIMLPLMTLLDQADAEALRRFVEAGGLLIAFARCASLTQQGWYQRRLPLAPLGAALGLLKIEPDGPGDHTVEFSGRSYQPRQKRDLLSPAPATEILARFSDGWPAVTLTRYGAGFGLCFATHADSDYVNGDGGLLRDVLTALGPRLGLTPRLHLVAEGMNTRELDPHLIETRHRSTILISSGLQEDRLAMLRLALGGRRISHVVQALPQEAGPVEWTLDAETLTMEVMVSKGRGAAIDVHWLVD